MKKSVEHILKFIHLVEQLKHELRHSWTSQGRQESVAEHSWRLSLMVLISAPYIKTEFDLLKALKMAVIHDIGEVIIGDKHIFEIISNPELAKNKRLKEYSAMRDLTSILEDSGAELFDIWSEFENNESLEAKIVNFLDKLEACIQHNEANINSWTNEEIEGIDKYFANLTSPEESLNELQTCIQLETKKKLKSVISRNNSRKNT